MKNIYFLILCFGMLGCASLKGSVDGDIYSSASSTFQAKIPDAHWNPRITDAETSYGELVRFDLPYGASRRIERFRINQHPISKLEANLDIAQQLKSVDSNMLNVFASTGVLNEKTIYSELKNIDGKRVLITYRYLNANNVLHYRSVLIHLSSQFVSTFHYTHPLLDESDKNKAVDRVVDLFKGFVENGA